MDKYASRKPTLKNPTYQAMIEGMDSAIGRVLQKLDKLNLANDTLVIFTSDNGPFAADVAPLRGEKAISTRVESAFR